MAFSWRSCYFPVVLMWLFYVFLQRSCAFLLHFPSKNRSKIDNFGVPGGHILDTFGALGASWAQVGAKGVLESALGCILAGFWPPFGNPWAYFFRYFWMQISSRKKVSFQTNILLYFGSILGRFLDTFLTCF